MEQSRHEIDDRQRASGKRTLDYAPLDKVAERGRVSRNLSLMAGTLSTFVMAKWGWQHFISRTGPNGLLTLPFVLVAFGGTGLGITAIIRSGRPLMGMPAILLNLLALALFFIYVNAVSDMLWMAP